LQIVNYSLFAIVGLIALGFSFSFAYAHTTIEVGPYEIEVGWQDEPPVVGILNAITIDIREPGDVEGVSMGVNNAFKNLQASVVSGGASKVLDINTDPRPGHYYAKIIPTKTGSLEIKLQGEVNGIKINEIIPVEDVESTSVLDFPTTSGSSSGQEVTALKNAVTSIQKDVSLIKSQVGGIDTSSGNFDAETSTGTAGEYVDIKETIRGFKEILEGKHDELPEQAFYMVGGIEQVLEKAKKMSN